MPSPTVVLPSIHEMFPDYLLAAKPPSASAPAANTAAPQPPPPAPFLGGLPPRNHYLPAPMPPPLTLRFAFDAHPPSSPSSSPTLLRSPTSTGSTVADGDRDGDSAESASDGQLSNEDDDDDDDGSSSPTSTRKHICPQCGKRFNRPSSLRIHVNTHTGATPFRCPYPNCGRAFNVNSNMRRHYRNHSAALSAAAGAVAARPGSSCASTFSACSTADTINLGQSHRLVAQSSAGATTSAPRVHPYQLRAPVLPRATISIPDADDESVSDGVSMDDEEEDDGDGDYKPGKGVPGLQIWSKSGGRTHACGQCGKRFKRPSSLKIHFNTHIRATPFLCPYPTCGRKYKVKSNLRRHQRFNHLQLDPLSPSTTTTAPASGSRALANSPSTTQQPLVPVSLPVHPYMQMTRPQPRPRPPRMPPPSYHDPHARKPSRCSSPAAAESPSFRDLVHGNEAECLGFYARARA
ncbi:hypothetical protein HMN09_00366000 [Mycena chlorophos]|uniref:C2H2-type domain-containing protein n=1 Tax=Mycena chlorophos TaxID=658473 RepID=A0A8H6WI67_MYCCL|nr:hypothetical protein HMN09_00366000 [Mycena chlorophos]